MATNVLACGGVNPGRTALPGLCADCHCSLMSGLAGSKLRGVAQAFGGAVAAAAKQHKATSAAIAVVGGDPLSVRYFSRVSCDF